MSGIVNFEAKYDIQKIIIQAIDGLIVEQITSESKIACIDIVDLKVGLYGVCKILSWIDNL